MTRRSNPLFPKIRIAAYVLVPAILILLPADQFDDGQSVCLSVALAQVECYACGLTRACMHLIHLDFLEAYYHNALSFIVFPLLAFLWLRWFVQDLKLVKGRKSELTAP